MRVWGTELKGVYYEVPGPETRTTELNSIRVKVGVRVKVGLDTKCNNNNTWLLYDLMQPQGRKEVQKRDS